MAGERVGVKGFSGRRRCEHSQHPEAGLFSRQTLACCVCRFFWQSDEEYPCVGQQTYPLHFTVEWAQEKITWIIGRERLGSNHGIDPSSDRAPQRRPGAWLREAGGANRMDAGNRHDLVAGASLGIGMLHRLNALSQSHQRRGDRDGMWATPQGSCGKG